MRKPWRILIVAVQCIILLSACLLPSPSNPTETAEPKLSDLIYYVSTEGNDLSSGSELKPWKTIQKAAKFGRGTIYVLAGTYPEQVTVNRPLIFEASGIVSMNGFIIKANNTIIRGFDITSPHIINGAFGVRIYNDNCIIENNYIHDTVRDGILLENTADGCIIRDNKFNHVSQSGIEIRGTNHKIENNEIWDTIQYPPEMANDSYWKGVADADGIRFFGSGHIIKGNYIHDIVYKLPENVDPHIDCFQTWGNIERGYAHDITFDGNTCILPDTGSGSGTTKGFQIEGAYNLTIINGVVHARLMAILDSDVAQTHDIIFLHNTFVGYPTDPTSWGINIVNTNYVTTNIRIQNNIFAYQENGLGSFLVNNQTTILQADHNCVYRTTGLPSRTADPGDVWNKDPLFVNYSANDFRLQPNSPCIDRGVNVGLTHDHDGNIRPQGAGYDIGAFEFVAPP